MPRYPIVIEQGASNYSAFAPDVPGCVATGASRDEVTEQMAAALRFHIASLRHDGEPIPSPGVSDTYVEI
jgi:predicted RNase H-like HicB family nuclease